MTRKKTNTFQEWQSASQYRWAYRWLFQLLITSIIYVWAKKCKDAYCAPLTQYKSLLFTWAILHGPVNFLIKDSRMLVFHASGMENTVLCAVGSAGSWSWGEDTTAFGWFLNQPETRLLSLWLNCQWSLFRRNFCLSAILLYFMLPHAQSKTSTFFPLSASSPVVLCYG